MGWGDDAWLATHRAKMAGYAAASPPPPSDPPKPKRRRRDLETPIHIAIYNFLVLALPDPLEPMHIPNGEKRGKAAAGRLKAMGTREGAADLLILGYMRGPIPSYIWFEVKSEDGTLSKAQKAWKEHCHRVNAPWFLVRSIGDAEAALLSLSIKLKARAS